ncbi:MAG: energy transducer TonB [Verrucomicrobiae bacterium]|nr:energy transducer TonB [Verrucomicrobiae bacterium]
MLNKALGRVRVGAFKTFGTVTLEFELDRTGKLMSRQIIRSSGDASLDKQALDMIDRAVFPPLPDALGGREMFTVPLEFKRAG